VALRKREQSSILKRLAGNTASLSATQVGRVVINTLIAILVSRMLGVEGFGKYGVLIAYLNIFQVLVRGGMPRLTIREIARHADRAQEWFRWALLGQVLSAVVVSVGLLATANMLNHPQDTKLALGVISLSLIPHAISSAAESVFQAQERMEFIALAQLGAQTAQLLSSVVVLLLGYRIVALAWVLVGGQCLMAFIEGVVIGRMGLWNGFRFDWKGSLHALKMSWDFFLMSVSVTVFNRLDVLILSQLVGETGVGVYNAAYLVVRVVNFVSISYSHSVYPVLSRFFGESSARFKLLLHKSLSLGVTGLLLPAAVISVMADVLVRILYRGDGYSLSATLLRIESPFIVIYLWNALLASGLMSSNRQRRSVIVSGVKMTAGFVYYLLLTEQLGVVGTAWATVLAGLTGAVLNYLFVNREVCRLDPVSSIGKPLVIGGLLAVTVLMTGGLSWPMSLGIVALVYLVSVLSLRLVSRDDLHLLHEILRP